MTPISISNRLEPFVDAHLIDRLDGLSHRLHIPTPQEISLVHDEPWEGNTCCYHTVFQDGEIYRMYYRGSRHDPVTTQTPYEVTCYAESSDGISWIKPNLGLYAFNGSKQNNIVWAETGAHDFSPFKDANPAAAPDARYKAIARGEDGLHVFKSPDGIAWTRMADHAVITEGKFDSQNLAFWDVEKNCYVDFHRGFRPVGDRKVRDIMTCRSPDFMTWSDPSYITQLGAPVEELYTNQIIPYYRAPHIYSGFPMRFVPGRSVYDIAKGGVSDGVFMTSRDGETFHRWPEAFLRPGPNDENWICRNNMIAWGVLETASRVPGQAEISLYATEHYYSRTRCDHLRRHSLRLDGFASLHADASTGQGLSKVLTFEGSRLAVNFSTSAVGRLAIEILDAEGSPLPGFTLADCDDLYGDAIRRPVTWQGSPSLGHLAGRPIRLRISLQDADLYAIQFGSDA
ncbi:MAG: hypothetical protein O3B73_06010 [bacterium]|nr:hypothetical protein [bacterium]